MEALKKLSYIFDRKQKIQVVLLGIMIFIGGIFETLSVSTLFPIVAVIMDGDSIMENAYAKPILEMFSIDNAHTLIIVLLFSMMGVYIVKNLYLLVLINVQTKFITFSKNKLISRVLREFLNRPYEFYLDADIPTVFRLTDSDIPNVFNMMMAIISLTSEVIVFVMLALVLIISDWRMTLFLVVVFGLLTALLTKILKPQLAKLGKKNQDIQSRIAKWRIEAIYGSIGRRSLQITMRSREK
jgi:ABC-type multidrug transport system fused ATPase/permease subunit